MFDFIRLLPRKNVPVRETSFCESMQEKDEVQILQMRIVIHIGSPPK
jgi:hypothetical protein